MPNILKIIRLLLAASFMLLAFLPLLQIHTGNSDFYRYFLWSKAFSSGDIFKLGGNILSPQGVPLSQWSFGPGLVFSLGTLFDAVTFKYAVYVGWLFAVVFWISYIGILLKVTKNNHTLVLFGIGITFVATPLGYYSSAYGSESLSYTALSVIIFWLFWRDKFTVLDCLMVGIWASLLVIIRSQLILYAAPAYLVLIYKIKDSFLEQKSYAKFLILAVIAATLPLLLSVTAILIVNYWMTGSYFGSVYNFGFGDFKSVDFANPEWSAILLHPWHGLFAYHPLYLLCFISLPTLLYKRWCEKKLRLLLTVVAAVVLMHTYLHASWYVWWLGLGSFGMRGLSISAVVLLPMLLHLMTTREERGESNSALLLLIAVISLWSFALLTQEVTQYYTYPQLFAGVAGTLDNLLRINFFHLPATLLVMWYFVAKRYGVKSPLFCFKNIMTMLVLLLLVHYQCVIFFYDTAGMLGCSFISTLLILLAVKGYHLTLNVFMEYAAIVQKSFITVSLICYAGLVILFINLAITTNRTIAAKVLPPPSYTVISNVDVNEVRASGAEYMNVQGFDEKKERLVRYLEYLDSPDNAVSRLLNQGK